MKNGPNLVQRQLLKWSGLSWLIDAANTVERYRRPIEPPTLNTISKEVTEYDWQILVSDSRKLFSNVGAAKGAICDKAVYAVGRAWNPKFLGADKAWGKQASDWLKDQWYPMADARGGMFDFKTDLYIASISADRDGEIYVLLTESENGWPQIQLLPATRIGAEKQDVEIVESGPYKGMQMIQGVIVNAQGRAVAYNVIGENPNESEQYSALNLIQIFDPEWADQVRGFPCLSHAILDLKDLQRVQGNEKIVSEIMSSVGLIETNEIGAPDANDPMRILRRNPVVNATQVPEVVTEIVNGVRNMYYRAGSGSKLEGLKNDRPGPDWDKFMNRLIRNACVGAGWPYELTWDASALGGANVRLLIARAMRTVQDRQDLLRPVAKRVVGYAVSKAIKLGIFPPNKEWYNWDFSLPPRMSVDYGRDAKADLDDYAAGLTTATRIFEEEGIDIEDHIAEAALEKKMFKDAGLIYMPEEQAQVDKIITKTGILPPDQLQPPSK